MIMLNGDAQIAALVEHVGLSAEDAEPEVVDSSARELLRKLGDCLFDKEWKDIDDDALLQENWALYVDYAINAAKDVENGAPLLGDPISPDFTQSLIKHKQRNGMTEKDFKNNIGIWTYEYLGQKIGNYLLRKPRKLFV